VAILAALVPVASSTASCQITCTNDITTGSCGTAVTNWKVVGCDLNGATYTQVSNRIAKCNGNLGCSDAGSISACNGVATSLSGNCGGCTAALVDCDDEKKCFPANATVLLHDGSRKTMAELQVGDTVHVGRGAFSQVFMFSHRIAAADSKTLFVSITATPDSAETSPAKPSSQGPLLLSADHYLYANDALVAASTVKVGDQLESGSGAPLRVTHVERVWGSGLYNPHTMTGDIVVDDIKTSCYTTAVHPTLAHAALWPVRTLYSAGVDIVNHAFDNGSELIASVMPDGPKRIQA
jgi:hypothetical protein